MKEQSDMPSWWRCDTHGPGTRTAWGCPECVRELRTSLATATRQLDEALALNAKWAEKAATWSASPEAAQRLQGYRDLAQQVAQAQNERDEAVARERVTVLDEVLRGLRSERDTNQLRAIIAEVEAIRARAEKETK